MHGARVQKEATMTISRKDAMKYVRKCAEAQGPETYAEAAELFAAIYARRPDKQDGDRFQVWSLCCAAVK